MPWMWLPSARTNISGIRLTNTRVEEIVEIVTDASFGCISRSYVDWLGQAGCGEERHSRLAASCSRSL